MKLCRFDQDKLGLVDGDQVVDVSAVLEILPRQRWPLAMGDPVISHLDQLRPEIAKAATTGARFALDDMAFTAPVANPGKIIGALVNYRDHAAEAEQDHDLNQGRRVMPIDEIGLFLKANSALAGPGDGVRLNFPDRRTDHEGEVVLVIGKTTSKISPIDAMDAVAGFTLGLDMTVRGKEDRSFRKSCDGYAVIGPWLVTAEEITNPAAIEITTKVNGEMRQQGSTADLIRSMAELIAMASDYYTLHPGDLIMTGTPSGVGPVASGDVIEVSAPEIGTLTTTVK